VEAPYRGIMATFTYTRDRPNPPNNPSSDVPDMKTNCNSIDDILKVNHFSFGSSTNNDGKHQFVEMPNRVVIPPGLILGEGTEYTKFITRALEGVSQMFYTPDNSAQEYQLTTCSPLNFPTFSTLTVFDVGLPRLSGGWSFLPGGMLIQYGLLSAPVNNDIIKYPVAFTTFAIPILTAVRNNTDDKALSIKDGSNNNTQFQIILSGSSLPTFLFWVAVGK
jgi:hypothetical protein